MTSEEPADHAGPDHQPPAEEQQHGGGQPPAAAKPPLTGDHTVDVAMQALTEANQSPVDEQVEAYVGAHRALQDRLADLDG